MEVWRPAVTETRIMSDLVIEQMYRPLILQSTLKDSALYL